MEQEEEEETDSAADRKTAEQKPLERLETLLNTPFFDPQKSAQPGEPKLLRDFRDLLEREPQTAEALFVGLYFALLLFFAQEGVHIYKHCYFMPDKQCPWDVGPSFDSLLDF